MVVAVVGVLLFVCLNFGIVMGVVVFVLVDCRQTYRNNYLLIQWHYGERLISVMFNVICDYNEERNTVKMLIFYLFRSRKYSRKLSSRNYRQPRILILLLTATGRDDYPHPPLRDGGNSSRGVFEENMIFFRLYSFQTSP